MTLSLHLGQNEYWISGMPGPLVGPFPEVQFFICYFKSLGEVTILQNLSEIIEMNRFSESRFKGIDSVRMAPNTLRHVCLPQEKGVLCCCSPVHLYTHWPIYLPCTVVCLTALSCVSLQLFHSIQRTCLDLSKAIVLYQKRICCKYGLCILLSQQWETAGYFPLAYHLISSGTTQGCVFIMSDGEKVSPSFTIH